MKDIDELRRNLLHDEYLTGNGLLADCKAAGFPVSIGFGIAYHVGVTDGKKAVRSREKELWQKLGQAEARIKELEGLLQIFKHEDASATVDPDSETGATDPEGTQPIPGVDKEGCVTDD